ncbi:MAG TPA: penicillin-binding protein 2 [Phycisphaerales bacterium]|nr:penicillin-binding protein 2 [Phycisphaerales bacterium]
MPTSSPDKSFQIVAAGMCAAITLALVVMLGRVAQLQLAPGVRLVEHMKPRITEREEVALRGDILDRRGRLIASTSIARRVVVDPVEFAKQEDVPGAIRRLAEAMAAPHAEIKARIEAVVAANAETQRVADGWPATATPDLIAKLVARRDKERKAQEAAHPAPGNGDAETPEPDHPPAIGAADPFAAAPAPAASPRAAVQVDPATLEPPKPVRYLPIGDVLSENAAAAVGRATSPRRSKTDPRPLSGVLLERVAVRDVDAQSPAAALVGKVGFGHVGLAGSEYRLEEKLSGEAGEIAYYRDRSGKPLWIEPGFVVPPKHGESVRLSIDVELQRIAVEELQTQIERTNAAGGRLILADPATGEILAMADIVRDVPEALPYPWAPVDEKGKPLPGAPPFDAKKRYIAIKADPGRAIHPALGRNRCVEDIYEPGSTFKPFVWATITELGLARVTEVFDTEGGKWWAPGGRYLEDVTRRDRMTWAEVLVNSSNIGMVKASQRMSYKQMHDLVRRFGFGERTQVGLPGESSGIVTPLSRWGVPTHVSVAYGHEVGVTPVQMVRAFSAFARTGSQAGTLPRLRLVAAEPDEAAPVTYRVLPSTVAELTRRTMKGVVDAVDARWAKDDTPEGGWRYDLFGKSGTAKIPCGAPPVGHKAPQGTKGYLDNQFISSFIAGGPVEQPRLVCLAIIDDPAGNPGEDRKKRYGSAAAGPVARRVMERALTYLGVPSSRAPGVSLTSR